MKLVSSTTISEAEALDMLREASQHLTALRQQTRALVAEARAAQAEQERQRKIKAALRALDCN